MGGRARFGARTLWKTLNATKKALSMQAALWEAARALRGAHLEPSKRH